MIRYTIAITVDDLLGILDLQKINLARFLDPEEIQREGFVTVSHGFDQMEKLNETEKHVIAKAGEKIIGYVLAMTVRSKADIPILVSMFRLFDQVPYKGKSISAYDYLVVGQVCVDKEYRGSGVFDRCYAYYKERYRGKYDFAITEISAINHRSLAAHRRIGFEPIHRYLKADDTEWVVVLWDWN